MNVKEFTIPLTVAEVDALDPPDIFLAPETEVTYLKPGFARRETALVGFMGLVPGDKIRIIPRNSGCVYFGHVEDVPEEDDDQPKVWLVLD